MKKLISLFIFSFFSLISLFSEVFLSETDYDFGEVSQKEVVSGSFFIFSDSSESCLITLASSCECLSIDKTSATVDGDNPVEVRFTFDTSNYADETSKDILLNVPNSPTLFFSVHGFVKSSNKSKDSQISAEFTNNLSNLETNPEDLHYFSYYSCKKCAKIYKDLKEKSGKNIFFYNLEDEKNKKNVYEISQKLGFYPSLPFLYTNNQYYFGKDQIDAFLLGKKTTQTTNAVQKLNIFAVILSGLLDGINPCAFTVIILLISYLSLHFKSKKSILLAGIFYTVSVFATYFLVGLGLFEFLRRISAYSIISKIIKYSITAFLVVLAVLSLVDYFKIKAGKSDEMVLKLPHFLQKSIRQNIRAQMKNYRIFLGSILLGLIVSLFELACTGQVYLPIIGYLVQTSNQRIFGLFLLLIYNIGFICPLIAVFVLVYKGFSSKQLGDFFAKHLGLVKLLFFGLFVIFSVINILF